MPRPRRAPARAAGFPGRDPASRRGAPARGPTARASPQVSAPGRVTTRSEALISSAIRGVKPYGWTRGELAARDSQPGREPGVTAGHGQHVHPGRGQGAGGPFHRAQPPSAAHEQDAPGVRRYPQRRPGCGPRPRVGEGGPHRRRHHGDPGPGQVAAHSGRPGRRGHQEQVDARRGPRSRGAGRRGRGPRVRGRGRHPASPAAAGTPAANTLMIMSAGSSCSCALEGGHQPRRGGTVHGRGQAAARPEVGEVQPVEDPGPGHQPTEDPVSGPARVRAQQGHAVQRPGCQPRPARLAETTSDTTSWPRPREPERITAR